jgi:arylsulfatase A-like enzyme
MTEAEKTKLLIHKNTLQKMLIETENEVHYYKYRYKDAVLETSKFKYKEAMNQYKAKYEALDYAIELINKELGEES